MSLEGGLGLVREWCTWVCVDAQVLGPACTTSSLLGGCVATESPRSTLCLPLGSPGLGSALGGHLPFPVPLFKDYTESCLLWQALLQQEYLVLWIPYPQDYCVHVSHLQEPRLRTLALFRPQVAPGILKAFWRLWEPGDPSCCCCFHLSLGISLGDCTSTTKLPPHFPGCTF